LVNKEKIMGAFKVFCCTATALLLLCAGCATSPETVTRRQIADAQINTILSEQLDPAEYGEIKSCLADREYRNFSVLDDRHILFEGLRGKLWVNTLPARCPDLRYGSLIRVESFSWSRLCENDSFMVGDWFDRTWYRSWPWHWGRGMGMQCSLGKFQPVTKDQVDEIRAALKSL